MKRMRTRGALAGICGGVVAMTFALFGGSAEAKPRAGSFGPPSALSPAQGASGGVGKRGFGAMPDDGSGVAVSGTNFPLGARPILEPLPPRRTRPSPPPAPTTPQP